MNYMTIYGSCSLNGEKQRPAPARCGLPIPPVSSNNVIGLRNMDSFISTGHYNIDGRGQVITVNNDKPRPRDNDGLRGNKVLIDGEQYLVHGVESFCVDPIRKGASIGLLVTKITDTSDGK